MRERGGEKIADGEEGVTAGTGSVDSYESEDDLNTDRGATTKRCLEDVG
jgi:hypothetical protein